MSKKNTRTWIARLLIMMLTLLGLGQTMVHAVEENGNGTTGPLTDVIITKVETNDEAEDMTLEQLADGVVVEDYFTDGKVLPGVSFTWFSVTDTQLATMEANPSDYKTVGDVEALVGVESGTATAETNANGQVTIPNLAEGHYWVVENEKGTITSFRAVPFGLTLPFTNLAGDGFLRAINVYPKNTLTDDEPDIEKTVDKSSVAIGELHTWKVSLKIPVGIEDYDKFSFYDEIDSRLDFEGVTSVEVDAVGINLIENTDYTVAYTDPKLEVVFTEAGRKKLKGADPNKVHISFDTRVNDTAIMGEDIPNDATLEFDNGHGHTGEKNPGEIPSVYTGGKVFKKRDKESHVGLPGAVFLIKNAAGDFIKVGEEVDKEGYITYVSENDATSFTSIADGAFEIKGLKDGTYTLVEIKAPDGYALPTNREVGTFEITKTSYDANNPKAIDNRALVIPQTGGIGTVVFTVIGAVMMLFSALFYKRTKEA